MMEEKMTGRHIIHYDDLFNSVYGYLTVFRPSSAVPGASEV